MCDFMFFEGDKVEFVGRQEERPMPWHPKIGTVGIVKDVSRFCVRVLWDTDDCMINSCWISMEQVIKVDKADCCASKELDDLFSEF